MKQVNADALFDYAMAFCKASEEKDRGSDYPTFREAAKKFKVRISDIEEAVETFHNDNQDERYMDAIVGVRCGAGIAPYNRVGDYKIEAYI
jgi:hypothetical protein